MQNIDLEKLQILRWLFSVYTNPNKQGNAPLVCLARMEEPSRMFTFLEFGVKMLSFDFHLENKKNQQALNGSQIYCHCVLPFAMLLVLDWHIFLNLSVRRCFSEVLCLHRKEWMEVEPADFSGTHSFFSPLCCVYSAHCPCVLAHAHKSYVVSSAW